MKHNRLWMALAALALGVGLASADYNIIDKGTYKQNASNGAKVDGAGNAYVTDYSRDRDNFTTVNLFDDTTSVADLIDTKSTAGQAYTAESSAVIACGQYRRFTLCLRMVPQGGDTTRRRFRFAVQVRKHTSGSADTSSTFAWSSWANTAVMSATGDDSTGHFTAAKFFPGTGASTASDPWSNERVFVFDGQRGNTVSSGVVGMSFGWPGGVAVDLCDARGQWFWGQYISVRVRCLSNGGTTINKPRIIGKLMMGS